MVNGSEMVSVEVGITKNLGDFENVRLTIGLSEVHTEGDKAVHTAKLYAKAEKLMLRKLARLISKVRNSDDKGE